MIEANKDIWFIENQRAGPAGVARKEATGQREGEFDRLRLGELPGAEAPRGGSS
jgi:hypothetical protein